MDSNEILQMAKEYIYGKSMEAIAIDHYCAYSTVGDYFVKAGVKIRKQGHSLKIKKAGLPASWFEMTMKFDEGVGFNELSFKYHCPVKVVQDRIRKVKYLLKG